MDFWFVHYQPCLDGCLNFVVTCFTIINEGSVVPINRPMVSIWFYSTKSYHLQIDTQTACQFG